MMTRDDVLELCASHKACGGAMDWLRTQPAEATADQLLACCKRGDWLMWLAGELGVGDDQVYVRIACEIARSVLHLVPEGEDRPRRAIEIAERSLTEYVTREELIDAARDAARAARAARDAACDAARAAGDAACDAAWAARDAADAAGAAREAACAARAAARAVAWYAACVARDAEDAAWQADIVMKHLPLEMWVDACSDPMKGSGK